MKNRYFAIFAIITIFVIFGAYQLKNQRAAANVHQVDHQELVDMRDNGHFYLVYVGAADTSKSQQYQSRLYNVAFAQRIPIYYYDTQNNQEPVTEAGVLAPLDLKKAPALYIIGNDQVIKLDPEIIDTPKFEAIKIDYHL